MASVVVTSARALIGFIGFVVLVFTISNLAGGNSITDPVFPGGLLLGASCVGAAAWTSSSGTWRALVVWLGVAAVLVTVAIFVAITFGTTDPSVYPLFIIPTVIVLAAIAVIGVARVRAGAFGASTTERTDVDRRRVNTPSTLPRHRNVL